MRFVMTLLFASVLAVAQESPVAAPAPSLITVDVTPLRPPDLATPYASPRDAARHRLQATLAGLEEKRDVRAAVRGFADALAMDQGYAIAAFNLGVTAALAEKWEDALAAFEAAARLDPAALGVQATPQLERLRVVAALEKTAEGKLKRRYDEAMLPVLQRLPKMPEAEAMASVAEVGRIDPNRWEAPALLAGLNGNGRGYDLASKFLEIAVRNAADPAVKSALEKALRAAEREMRYAAARTAAEAASDRGEHAKAAELYESAWTAMPARSDNGMAAAAALLLEDNTPRSAALLVRLRESGDTSLVPAATSMLKQLEPIESAAKSGAGDGEQFFRDPGTTEPVRIATLLPPVDRSAMEVLSRQLPKLVQDPEPVVTLASLSLNPADSALAASLPVLPEPALAGDRPFQEAQAASKRSAIPTTPSEPAAPRTKETADLSSHAKGARLLQVTTEPEGAQVFIGAASEPLCQSPCDVKVDAGSYMVRVSLAGYQDAERSVRAASKTTEASFPLTVARGSVLVETAAAASLKVNGSAVNASAPVELSLAPGLHTITADFGSATREIALTVKPGARLRVQLRP